MVPHNEKAKEGVPVKKMTRTVCAASAVSVLIAVIIIIRCGAPPGALLVV